MTTIVLSGGRGEEPPAVGTTIEVPEDDQHQIVIGGPDGEVIREEFIGDQAGVIGYGPIVRDADGNWSVLTTIEVSVAPEVEPKPEPAPELVGVPESLATFVAELPPEGAGAVRDLADQVEGLRERVERPEKEDEGDFEWKVPAGDISPLREIAPDILKDVRPVSGSILVATEIAGITVKTYVTPIVKDGLIEVRLSKFGRLAEHQVVKALLATLNGAVHGRGRFDDISVTPEGLVVTFLRKVEE